MATPNRNGTSVAACASRVASSRRRFGRGGRDVARPVAEERPEAHRVAHDDEHRQDEGRPERPEGVLPARVAGVEHRGEGDDAEQEQQAVADDHDLVDQQHELVAVDDDHDDQRADDRVDDRAQQLAVGHAGEAAERADDGVAAHPHADREERDRGEQGQERADDPAGGAEVRAGGHGVVGAGPGPEQAHGRQHERAERRRRAAWRGRRRGTTARGATGNVPRMTVAKVFAPPNWIRNRSRGRDVRSSCGMVSTLYCSTSVARGGRRTAGADGRAVGGEAATGAPRRQGWCDGREPVSWRATCVT